MVCKQSTKTDIDIAPTDQQAALIGQNETD